MAPAVKLDVSLCTGCGLCVSVCSKDVFSLDAKTHKAVIANPGMCNGHGHCTAVCPVQAVTQFSMSPTKEQQIYENDTPIVRALKIRRTCRNYKEDLLPKEEIMRVINMTKYCASSMNQRPLKFTVVSRPRLAAIVEAIVDLVKGSPSRAEQIRRYREEGADFVFRGAPHIIVVSGPSDAVLDAGIAGAQMQLYAESLGYGTTWLGFPTSVFASNQSIGGMIAIPAGGAFLCTIGIGHPSVCFARPALRRDLAEGLGVNFLD